MLDRGEAVRTHLSGWIDCHSRYLIEGRYYFRENLDILIEVKAKLDVERKGPMEFVWSSTGEDGTRSSLTFKKIKEPEREGVKGKQRR